MKSHKKLLAVCLMSGLGLSSWAQAATEEDIDNKVYQFGKKRKRTTFFDLRETT